MTENQAAFHSLPADHFPMEMVFIDEVTGETLWQEIITGPGLVRVPGFAPRKVSTIITFGNGTKIRSDSSGMTHLDD